MTQAVKRACDACHRRKVKCDGINPCRNCSQAQLSCTYNAVPQKKGPKGSRAKVISELRETQRQTSLAAKVHSRIHGVPCQTVGLSPMPGLLSGDFVKDCLNFYFDNMYAKLPILDRRTIEQQVMYIEQNLDAYCLVTSLCAFVMLQPGMAMPASEHYHMEMMPGANIVSSQLLVEETLRVRKGFEYLDSLTHNAVATDYFLFACHYAQEMHDRAWYYLREATTMVHMAGMNKEDHYMQFDAVESSRRRRLFWLLYSTERAYAIRQQRPLTLEASINLPTAGDDPSDPLGHQLNSFITLANLFKPFDAAFLASWDKTRSNVSTQHMDRLQKQLTELVQNYACQDPNFGEMQTNQSWLKNTFWQLTNGNVTSDDSMSSYQYPASMARDLLMGMAAQFPGQGMELMTSGLIEKLLDITHATNELLAMQPAPRDPFAVGPREEMDSLLNIVALSRNGDHRFLPCLMNRVAEILPGLVNPMLQIAPDNPAMANMDIFDGFGNAGMAQVPQQMQMGVDADYDQKFPVEEYDKQYAMEMNNSTPESQQNSNASTYGQASQPQQAQGQGSDMNSSFVGSPGIMSPGMEYQPAMSGFPATTPMSDMVMSPMGHPSQANAMSTQQHQHMSSQGMNHNHDGLSRQTQHMPSQGHESLGQHMQGMPPHQGVNTPISASHPMNNMCAMRQQQQQQQAQQRQNSFRLQAPPPPQMRTVGDFQGLQRAGLGTMNSEIDFGSLQ